MTLEKLNQLDNGFRGAPFWAWNAKLNPQKLISQIHIMKEMGFGGFFMHSRVGLDTPYLKREWFECVRVCVEEAKKLNMSAWLYDEDRWPSGAAGGLATKEDSFKMKELLIERDAMTQTGHTLALYAVQWKENQILSYRRIRKETETETGESIVRCYYDFSKRSSEFNGETYLDTLNPKAVERFMEITHEAYYKEFKSYFGNTIPGIFTDEPCYALPYRGDLNLPWTENLESIFQKKYGYDLLDHLIELYDACGIEVSKARCDYYNLITELFVHSFGEKIADWCSRHQAVLTGHILWEDELDGQAAYVGDAMRFYEYMQIPGIDLLTERWTSFATVKQCVSVARQLGTKRRLCEMYGCTGWDFPLFAHKSLGDWQYALGINFRCQHLSWYSMEAEAKRDYPASFSAHSPWYRTYQAMEGHFTRLGKIISEGKEIRDILVIHPMESVWSVRYRISTQTVPAVQELHSEFVALANRLLAENLDYDYGDEELLRRHAKVQGKNLTVGLAEYKTVILPKLKTIRSSTLELLEQFAENGGNVFYIESLPEFVDAVRSDRAKGLMQKFHPLSLERISGHSKSIGRRVSMTAPDGKEVEPLLYHLSENEKDLSLFVCNVGVNFSNDCMKQCLVRDRKLTFPKVKITLCAESGKSLYEIDTLHGTIHEIVFSYEDFKYCFFTSFHELTSRLFYFSEEKIQGALPPPPMLETVETRPLDLKDIRITRDEPNVLVLDHVDTYVDNQKFNTGTYILQTDDALRKMLGKPPRGGSMVQPYLKEKKAPEKWLNLRLEYKFHCSSVPKSCCRLAIEHPEFYAISMNGIQIESKTSSFWMDEVLRTVELPAACISEGINILSLETRYHENLPGLEPIFLLGEFGIWEDCMKELPETLNYGDWCKQGFMYYSGNMTYRIPLGKIQQDKQIFLNIPAWRGSVLGVTINHSSERILFCAPYEIELNEHLSYDGNDYAEITLYSHRRNLFGPFYLREKWPAWTGAAQFKMYETADRQLVECGLMKPVELKLKKVISSSAFESK